MSAPTSWLASPPTRAIVDLLDEALDLFDIDRTAAKARLLRARALAEPAPAETDLRARASAGLSAWRTRQVIDFIDANIGRVIYTAELAGAAKMSTSQLNRALKSTFGLSPADFIMHRRLALARRLMLETDDRLAVVAQACGLCDQAHLSRAFCKVYGAPPGRWRREQRALGARSAFGPATD